MRRIASFYTCWVLIFLWACNQPTGTISLAENGLPIMLKAPSGSTVETFDLIVLKEYTIFTQKTGIQLLVMPQSCGSSLESLDKQKEKVLSNSASSVILEEWDDGFTYSFQLESDTLNNYLYGLRRVLCKDSTMIVIKELDSNFFSESTLKLAKKMAFSATWID